MSDHAEDSMEGEVGEARTPLPQTRGGLTHKASIEGYEFYITANTHPDGRLGEIFIHGAGKDGSTVQGLFDAFAMTFSIALQYGAEFPMLARKLAHMRFEPMGHTDSPKVPYARSMMDYIMKWLAANFGDEKLVEDLERIGREMHPWH